MGQEEEQGEELSFQILAGTNVWMESSIIQAQNIGCEKAFVIRGLAFKGGSG